MTGDTKRQDKAAAEAREDQASPAAAADGNDSASAQADDRAELIAAAEELREKYLRAVAEIENIRKRTEREVADARAYGIAAFARDVINVADNLARALDAIEPEARATADGTLKGLLEGVDLTGRELQKTLEKHGIRPIDPKGEKFDPHFHQAMFEVPDPEVAAGTVVQVVQTGYAIADRVLRPALVAVSKGGAKAGPQEQASPPGEGVENSD